jgi:hypothetical protein
VSADPGETVFARQNEMLERMPWVQGQTLVTIGLTVVIVSRMALF